MASSLKRKNSHHNASSEERLAPSQRRLQRPPDFTGDRLNRFSQIFLRHGLPIALLGALCLIVPEMRALLADALAPLLAAPLRYLSTGLATLAALIAYAFYLDRRLDAGAMGWMLYLLAVSIWEEWVFRLAVPYFGETQGINLWMLVLTANLAFGAMHYFTLRWKWPWCLAAFLGGIALSRNLNQNFDLALVIAIHWVATYINTPRLPGRSPQQEQRPQD
jgi:hypothetical protein